MLLKTFKYRLYPTRQQTETLEWTLARCCDLYNAALQERRDAWNVCKRHPNFYDAQWRKEQAKDYSVTYNTQAMHLPALKEEREDYRAIHSQILQDTLKRVDKAMQAFFRRVKQGDKAGYPRFQPRARYDSFTYPQAGFSLEEHRLTLSKIGEVKVTLHRPIGGTIKTCTVKREGMHWYVCFACEVEAQPCLPSTDEAVGIDLGVSKLATLSTGDVIENPRFYRHAEKRLEQAQQALSRKKRHSHRRKKAVQRVARIHRKIRNQRQDYLHQWSRRLVNTYETIVFEDIAPVNLSKRAQPKQDETTGEYLPNGGSAKSGLNKSILDAGWSQFIGYCEYKAESAGTQVVKVNPRYTSQICSQCGSVVKKELSERWHQCDCGCSLDRDHNAAYNILRLGSSLRIPSPRASEESYVEAPAF